MLIRSLVVVTLSFIAAPAFAGVDLVTSISAAASPALSGQFVRYTVNVENTGSQSASNVAVVVNLPATATSPQVYVYGTLGAKSPACAVAGTNLNCTLGTVQRRSTRTVFFDLALPVSTRVFQLQATASTTSSQSSTANDSATLQPVMSYHPTPVNAAPIVTMTNSHCAGTGLTGWFECALFPSSVSSFQTTLASNGTLAVVGEPSYFGTWQLVANPPNGPIGNRLTFHIEDSSGPVADFLGWGADGTCFQGLTTFPGGGAYVSPYRVCP